MDKTKRIKRSGLIVIAFLIFQTTFSQENFIPGYVIKNNDTLFGLVDYRNWERNPDKINFKFNEVNDQVSYNPTDIAEFGVKEEIYVSAIVETEITPTQSGKLEEDPLMRIKVDTTFLQTILRGEKSLYYYKNAYGRENFYIKQGEEFDLLHYKRYLTKQDGKRIIVENKKYVGQLNLYLHGCETIYSRLEDISYNLKSLKNLFEYYYECSPSEITFEKETEKIIPEFGMVAGASLTSLEFKSREFPYLVNGGFASSANFSAGLFLDVVLTRNQRKWSIYNELLFTSYKTEGYFEKFEDANSYEKTTTEIGFSYLKLNNLIRYTYPIGNSYIFLNGGMSNGFAVSETNYKKREFRMNSIERVVEESALNSTRKHEQGFLLGAGFKYSKYSLELRYERGNGMSDFSGLNSITKSYYILLGYRF